MLVGVWGVAPGRLQLLCERGGVDPRADEDQLGEAFASGRPGLRVEAQEPSDGMDGVAVADVVRPEVDVALDPVQPLGATVEERHQAARVEGVRGDERQAVVGGVQVTGVVVGAVAGAVQVVFVQVVLVQPVLVPVVSVQVVSVQVVEGQLPDALLARTAVEEELGFDPAVGGRDDGGAVDEGPDQPEDAFAVRCPVELVDHDEVGQREMPVDLGVSGPGVVELGGVDDLDEPAVHHPRMLAGQQHPHEFLRLGEAAGLDDDDVDAEGGFREPLQIRVQFARVDGTAQAAVAEGDRRVAERSRHGHRVDLDRPEVVDESADTAAAAAVQEVVEQGGLPRAEESGQDDDRDLLRFRTRLAHRATSLAPTRAPARVPGTRGKWGCRPRIRAVRSTPK